MLLLLYNGVATPLRLASPASSLSVLSSLLYSLELLIIIDLHIANMSDGRKASLALFTLLSLHLLRYQLLTSLSVNDARAIRVAEIMTDFRNLQHYLVQLHASPTAEEYYLEGYALLRQCTAEAQAILQTHFSGSSGAATGHPEHEKQQLKTYVDTAPWPIIHGVASND
jgi:hypothetical protein